MAIKEVILCNECLALDPPKEVEGEELLIGGMFRAHVCAKTHKKQAEAVQAYLDNHTQYVPMQSTRVRKTGEIKAGGNEAAGEYFKCGDCGNVVKKVTKYTHAKTRHNKSTRDIEWTPADAPSA